MCQAASTALNPQRQRHDTTLCADWAESHNTEWGLHLPYNPTAARLTERHNGLLKTEGGSLQGWTTRLSDVLLPRNEKPRPDQPAEFHRQEQNGHPH